MKIAKEKNFFLVIILPNYDLFQQKFDVNLLPTQLYFKIRIAIIKHNFYIISFNLYFILLKKDKIF